jgi:hypothetical protein
MIQTQWIGGSYPAPAVPIKRGITGTDSIRESLRRTPGQTTEEVATSTDLKKHSVSSTLDRMRTRGEVVARKEWVSRMGGGNLSNRWYLA